MSLIPTSHITVAGTKPAFNAAAAGDTATVGPTMTLIVKNGDASDHTVTIAVPGSGPNGVAIADTTVTVPHGDEVHLPLDDYYADPVDKKAHISYSATTSMTRAVTRR